MRTDGTRTTFTSGIGRALALVLTMICAGTIVGVTAAVIAYYFGDGASVALCGLSVSLVVVRLARQAVIVNDKEVLARNIISTRRMARGEIETLATCDPPLVTLFARGWNTGAYVRVRSRNRTMYPSALLRLEDKADHEAFARLLGLELDDDVEC